MDSTENSSGKNKYFISEDLLDILIHEYMTASGEYQRTQKELFKQDAESIKNNMLAAHGMGHLLLNIMTRIPKELIHGSSTREHIWKTLTGTDCGTNRSRGGKPTPDKIGGGKSKGEKSWFSFGRG